MKRLMSVAGSFYPAQAEEIEKFFKYFNKVYDKHLGYADQKSKVVIVPHAGYIYSGFTANAAYRVLQNSSLSRFVVIGPSHRVGFNGISLCEFEEYLTPFGSLKSDEKLVSDLKKEFGLTCIEQAHHEHSTEVQFPFVKYYIPDATLVELVYSNADSDTLSKIIDFLLKEGDVGIIISTDLSHFYNQQEANVLDHICIEGIERINTDKLHEGCEACGMIGVEALLKSAKKIGMVSRIIDYRTSADVSEDTQSVVGYVSAYFT